MRTSTLLESRRGEYSLLEVCLPGQPPETIGILLHDPESAVYGLRFRRDWDTFGEEAEVLAALAEDFAGKLGELGPEVWLRRCEADLSNTFRISDREPVLYANLDQTLHRLYGQHVRPRVLPFLTHLPKYSAT